MFTQLIRIGRDSTLRYTQQGKAVCSIAGAYDVGYGDNKKTQWIDCALWEKRAESLAQYLVKGQECMVTLDDVHIDIYEGQNGPRSTLKARVVDIKLCGGKPQNRQSQSAGQQQTNVNQNSGQQQSNQNDGGFDDGSDIPF